MAITRIIPRIMQYAISIYFKHLCDILFSRFLYYPIFVIVNSTLKFLIDEIFQTPYNINKLLCTN